MTTAPITLSARATSAGKMALRAETLDGLKSKTKYVVGGYPFYVVVARESRWTYEKGEAVLKPSVDVRVDKRTRSKETAIREFKKSGPGAAILWRSPTGEFEIVARSAGIAPPE
ncbi:MAG: hypothetical protein K0U49_11595 [Alphaproteobacteria bacterium]|nr:hypothetical protein [Alphaproteobacteria bacterium]